MPEVSTTQARNNLARLIRRVEGGESVHITRRGKLVAVLVSVDEHERPKSGSAGRDFWQAITDWRAQASFDWPDLTPEEVDSWRDRRPPREPEWPE